ncbi:hypothetical protein Tco_0837023 [Tanacetum coccineum]
MDLMEDMLLLKFLADPGRRNHQCYCPRAPAEVCRQHWLSDVSFTITKFFPYGTIELSQPDVPNFKVNVIRLNALLRGLTPQGSPGSPHSP